MTTPAFKDNVIILTGASQGIGKQLALQLADQGAWLALAARQPDTLDPVAEECRKRGGKAIAVPTDVTDEAQVKHLVAETIAAYGRIDTLLNNAGRAYPKRFEKMTDLNNLRAEMTLNYLGLAYCVFYSLPYIRQQKGRIVGVGSFGGVVGLPEMIGYNSSKHAMRGFLNTLRAELAGTGVTVTLVFPGAISTERLRETMGDKMRSVPTMTPERCAEITLRVAAQRKRQVIMTPAGKMIFWLSLLVPSVLDAQLNRLGDLYSD